MSFRDLGLSEDVLRAVDEAGYTTPTPIQAQAIPTVLMGRDVLGCAQTGTGKTASFTLPMIEILAAGRARARMPRSLILEPTRELATQVSKNFETYGKYHPLSMALLIGGESFAEQEKKLDRGVDVLIATPGRLIDLFERGKILLSDVRIFVIDEADRMLDMGFIPDVERIASLLPQIRQTLFFSATMPPEIRRLADKFLMNPKEITVAPPASPAVTVEQHLAIVEADDKREALRRILQQEDVKNAFIFCNRKRDVSILYKSLARHGFNAGELHGDMPQPKRTETLDRFRNDDITLLVCSDVAARGLDIAGVSHVFNFDTPIHAEDYVHRIGRTGRAGRSGRAFTLATPDDSKFVAAIESLIGRAIPRIPVPGMEPLELVPEEEAGKRRRRRKPEAAETSGGRRGRGRRGEAAATVEAAPPAPVEAPAPVQEAAPAEPAPAPVEEHRRERGGRDRDRRRGERQAERPAEERVERAEPQRRQEHRRPEGRRDSRRSQDELPDTPVVGFGDHVPAFLLRRIRRPDIKE